MVDEETTISEYGLNASPVFRLTEDGDKTVIREYGTNTPVWVIDGKVGGGGVEVMTTAERLATTPDAGDLIYDSTDGNLYVGDGVTVGGTPVSNSELETRVDALETAVGIIQEGGEVVQGGYFCGDWTDENVDAIIFGAWSAS